MTYEPPTKRIINRGQINVNDCKYTTKDATENNMYDTNYADYLQIETLPNI